MIDAPERIWIEEDSIPYYYQEAELHDAGSPVTEYIRSDLIPAPPTTADALREALRQIAVMVASERHNGNRNDLVACAAVRLARALLLATLRAYRIERIDMTDKWQPIETAPKDGSRVPPLDRKTAVAIATARLNERASDWTYGKPDEDDIKQLAETVVAELGNDLRVDYDEYGNPTFS